MAIDFPASPSNGQTFTDGSTTWTWDGTKWSITSGGGGGGSSIVQGNTSASVVDTGSDGRFVVTTEGSEALRVDKSGRLLVGTSSSTQDSAAVFQANSSSTTSYGQIKLARGSSPSDGFRIGSLEFTDNTHAEAASLSAARDGGTWTSGSSQPTRLIFSTTADGAYSPTERMRIWSTGDVSFNGTNVTTSNGNAGNSYKFFGGANSVNIVAESSGADRALNIEYRRTGRTNPRASQIVIGENPSNQGQVIVYSSTANGGVTGGVILSNAATSWASNSDVRLKTIVSHFDNALSDVSALEAFRFTWKDDASETLQVGVSAQSVQTILPEAVSSGRRINAEDDDNTEYLSVRYTEIIPLLVAALQESKARIETLEVANTDLAARLTALEGGTN